MNIRVRNFVCAVCIGVGLLGCGFSPKEGGYGTPKASTKATLRPYVVNGQRYVPTLVEVGTKMYGIASWYGPKFHGKLTSNGERYNMYAYTAAHKTWPMNTMVRVRNLENGHSVIVRINDRGPFVRGRIIDCSYAAGKRLGLDRSGLAKVEIEVVGHSAKIARQLPRQKKKVHKVADRSAYGVQLGVFLSQNGALRHLERMRALYPDHPIRLQESGSDRGTYFRVVAEGFLDKSDAIAFIKQNGIKGAFVISADQRKKYDTQKKKNQRDRYRGFG